MADSRSRPSLLAASGLLILVITTGVVVVALRGGSSAGGPVAAGSTARTAAPSADVPAPTSTSSAAASRSASASTTALAKLTRLVSARSKSSTSVAALDTVTGATASAGATSGMTAASAAKVELLESLLLTRQRSDESLSSSELASVTAMIEHSDNSAADDVFYDIGGRDAVEDDENDLGLSTRRTELGDSDLWGLTTTSAAQQLVLLRNLVEADSPLNATNRALALRLMRNVEVDQTWGVPVAATSGHPAVKNGWLGVGTDNGLWAVNSLGVVTINGHTVVMAVMTQHNSSYAGGVTRVQSLVRATAAVLNS